MGKHNCETCSFRARYDHNPKSLLGRLWHWHTRWCPRWRYYLNSLDQQERDRLVVKYQLRHGTVRAMEDIQEK